MAPSPATTPRPRSARWRRASNPRKGRWRARWRGRWKRQSRCSGSVAGRRRAGMIVGWRVTGVGGRFAAPRFTLARRGALLAGSNAQALDAPWIGVEHFDLKIARPRDHLAAHRQTPDVSDEITAQRLDFLAGLA